MLSLMTRFCQKTICTHIEEFCWSFCALGPCKVGPTSPSIFGGRDEEHLKTFAFFSSYKLVLCCVVAGMVITNSTSFVTSGTVCSSSGNEQILIL